MSDQLTFETGFFLGPNEIFDNEAVSVHEKLTYLYLCRCANNSTAAFPSYATIAAKCSISRRKAIECVEQLIEKELLQKTVRRGDSKNMSNLYKILRVGAPRALGGAQHALGVVQDMHQGGAHGAPYKELIINNHSYKEPLNKEHVPDGTSADSDFEKWWSVYPSERRRDKAKTKAKWKQAAKEVGAVELLAMTALYASDKRAIGADGKFAKMPITFLNAKTYLDYKGVTPGEADQPGGSSSSLNRFVIE